MDLGLLSTDCTRNPHFCNWTVVYFIYCDGSSFTGSRAETLVANGTRLWMRDRANLDALYHQLPTNETASGAPRFGLTNASHVIVTGASVGGYFSFYHCDYIRVIYITDTSVPMHCVPDAGF